MVQYNDTARTLKPAERHVTHPYRHMTTRNNRRLLNNKHIGQTKDPSLVFSSSVDFLKRSILGLPSRLIYLDTVCIITSWLEN